MTCIGRFSAQCALAALAVVSCGLAARAAGDPRDSVNPPDYVHGGTIGTTVATTANHINEIGRVPVAGGGGYYIHPTTGQPIPDPATNPGAVSTEYAAPGPGASSPASSGRKAWNPTTWFGSGGGNKRTDRAGYETPLAANNPPPTPPIFNPGPVPPGPTITYVPGHNMNTCGSGGCGSGTTCSRLSVTGINQDIPPDVGIRLPAGVDLETSVRDVRYVSPNLRDTGVPGATYVPSAAPAVIPSSTGGYVSGAPIHNPPLYLPAETYGSGMPPPGAAAPYAAPVVSYAPTAAYVPPPTVYTPPAANRTAPAMATSVEGQAAFERGKALMRQEQYETAIAELDRALAAGYVTAEVFRWKGDGLYNLLRLQEAIQAYEESLRMADTYFARRGRGLAYLHRGHQIHGYQIEAAARGDKQKVAEHFAEAHEQYITALNILRTCVTERPNDPDAVYGLAMAAEGTSRFLYSMSVLYLRKGDRVMAEKSMTECFNTIKEGLEYAMRRYEKFGKAAKKDSGPLSLAGGLYLRRAMLEYLLKQNDVALQDVQMAMKAHQMILRDIDPNNAAAQKSLRECQREYERMSGSAPTM